MPNSKEKADDEKLDLVTQVVYSFFCESSDFNGISLRDISKKTGMEYKLSIDIVKQLVEQGDLSIQSSTNPHIIGVRHHPIEAQLELLEQAKSFTVTEKKVGPITFVSENTDYPICVYPSSLYLQAHRDLDSFSYAKYSKALALGEGQLSFRFFESDVIERYAADPRFLFSFEDFSGHISCKYDDDGNPIVREEDQVFVKSFGLGFDSAKNRVIAVILRDLGRLSPEHQIHWSAKELPATECKVLSDYYDNAINGNWITVRSVFTALIDEINAIHTLTESIFGVPLFRKSLDGDNRPRNFTFFFSPTTKNYYDFINLLDKYLSENINKAFFKDWLELEELKKTDDETFERIQKGTLRLLEEWISKVFRFASEDAPSELMAPLKKVRKERQKPAHKIIDNTFDTGLIDLQKEVIQSCYFSLGSLRRLLQSHPKASSVELNNAIDKDNVKCF